MHPLTLQLKAKYPRPQKYDMAQHFDPACYCVGGSLVLETTALHPNFVHPNHQKLLTFPVEQTIAEALQVHNPALSYDAAEWYADKIVYFNDKQLFGSAWDVMDLALIDDGTAFPEMQDDDE
jgi:hypothetical protein